MCFYWDVKIWYYLGQKPAFFPLSEAMKFSWWSLGALSLREYTFKSKSFRSSQIVFERNVPWSVMSHAMLLGHWQTHAERDIVGKGYCTCFCMQCTGCDMLLDDKSWQKNKNRGWPNSDQILKDRNNKWWIYDSSHSKWFQLWLLVIFILKGS